MTMTRMRRNEWRGGAAALLLALALPLVAACDDQQSAEKAGQEVGRALDETAERIGNSVDEVAGSAGRMMQDAGHAIEQKAREAQGTAVPEQPRTDP